MAYLYGLDLGYLHQNVLLLFGNIEKICILSEEFLNSLQKCNYSYEKIGQTFLNYVSVYVIINSI